MWHELNSQPFEVIELIIALPASKNLLKLFISLEVFEGKKVFFDPYKGKLLNIVIYLSPHILGIDSKLKQSAVLQPDEEFIVILIICIFMQFFNLAQREVKQTAAKLEHNLIVAQDKDYFVILSIYCF